MWERSGEDAVVGEEAHAASKEAVSDGNDDEG
jgi:hypothetical protein